MTDTFVFDLEQSRRDIRERIEQADWAGAGRYLRDLHPSDAAHILTILPPEQRHQIVMTLDTAYLADILGQMEEQDMASIAESLPTEQLADTLDEMEPDDAADLLGELSDDAQAALLREMEEADEVVPLLDYPPDTAGGIMNRPGPMLRRHMTVTQAVEFLREHYKTEGELFYLYVLDRHGTLVGVVSLRGLLLARPGRRIEELMSPDVISVPAEVDQEEAARTLARYDFLALPVVDAENRLVGIISVDDVVDVLEEEATEDIYRLAQVSEEAEIFSPLRQALRNRLTWLMVNLATAFLASAVVSLFESTIARAAVLATFMPIVAGQGGNAGIQTSTIVIRSLALGKLHLRDAWRALRYELLLGLINGISIGLIVAVVALLWKGNPILGVIIGVAMIGNMLVAAAAGVAFPMILKRLNLDPALASGIFLTTATDVFGFFLFLGLGAYFLL